MDIEAKVIEVTSRLRLELENPSNKVKLTDQQERVLTCLQEKKFGCNQEAVEELMSALLGTEIPSTSDMVTLSSWLAICRVKGSTPGNETRVHLGGKAEGGSLRFMNVKGGLASPAKTLDFAAGLYRLATTKEIQEFFKTMYNNNK